MTQEEELELRERISRLERLVEVAIEPVVDRLYGLPGMNDLFNLKEMNEDFYYEDH